MTKKAKCLLPLLLGISTMQIHSIYQVAVKEHLTVVWYKGAIIESILR